MLTSVKCKTASITSFLALSELAVIFIIMNVINLIYSTS